MSQQHTEILFVSHKYPPATGGMEKQSFELINGISAQQITHRIIFDQSESIISFFRKLNRRILQKLKEHPQIGIIHFNDGLIAAFVTFHKRYENIQQVVTIHGLDIVFPLAYFQKKIIPKFNTFDKIIAVSEATAIAAIKRGIQKEKVIVINNGVDLNIQADNVTTLEELYFKYPQLSRREKFFVTLGRPVKRKGFSWLLKNVIPNVHGNFQLIMIGPFDKKPTRKEKILSILPESLYQLITLFLGFPTDQKKIRKQLKKQAYKATHLGKIPFQDLQILLANAEAFLMPNVPVEGDMEGFGLVCLEASLLGTLVVASELEGITDAIRQDVNGILLPTLNSTSWSSQLQSIIDEPEKYKAIQEKFTENSAKFFSWDKMCHAYLKVFEELNSK